MVEPGLSATEMIEMSQVDHRGVNSTRCLLFEYVLVSVWVRAGRGRRNKHRFPRTIRLPSQDEGGHNFRSHCWTQCHLAASGVFHSSVLLLCPVWLFSWSTMFHKFCIYSKILFSSCCVFSNYHKLYSNVQIEPGPLCVKLACPPPSHPPEDICGGWEEGEHLRLGYLMILYCP